MKALPLWQPWATLIAMEAKRIETRHWPPPRELIGQRIAIYASKTLKVSECKCDPFCLYVPRPRDLPVSAIICTAVIEGVDRISRRYADTLRSERPHEFAFGNYGTEFEQRYAWRLVAVDRFDPIPWKWPFKGPAKFFDVSDDLRPPVEEALSVEPEPEPQQAALF